MKFRCSSERHYRLPSRTDGDASIGFMGQVTLPDPIADCKGIFPKQNEWILLDLFAEAEKARARDRADSASLLLRDWQRNQKINRRELEIGRSYCKESEGRLNPKFILFYVEKSLATALQENASPCRNAAPPSEHFFKIVVFILTRQRCQSYLFGVIFGPEMKP